MNRGPAYIGDRHLNRSNLPNPFQSISGHTQYQSQVTHNIHRRLHNGISQIVLGNSATQEEMAAVHIGVYQNLSHLRRTIFCYNSSPGQNGCHFKDEIFRCISMNEKFCILINNSMKFVPKGPIDNNAAMYIYCSIYALQNNISFAICVH